MHNELKELVYGPYLQLVDDACTQAREVMERQGVDLEQAVMEMKRISAFPVRIRFDKNIRSLTERNQEACRELLGDACDQLGITQHESLMHVIRLQAQTLFGLKPTEG